MKLESLPEVTRGGFPAAQKQMAASWAAKKQVKQRFELVRETIVSSALDLLDRMIRVAKNEASP